MAVDVSSDQISAIQVQAHMRAAELIEVLRGHGATVIWHGPRAAADLGICLDVEVDTDDAAEALPASYFAESEEWQEPDEFDIVEFIAACHAGDRSLAMAMLRRLNLSERSYDQGERYLVACGPAWSVAA